MVACVRVAAVRPSTSTLFFTPFTALCTALRYVMHYAMHYSGTFIQLWPLRTYRALRPQIKTRVEAEGMYAKFVALESEVVITLISMISALFHWQVHLSSSSFPVKFKLELWYLVVAAEFVCRRWSR